MTTPRDCWIALKKLAATYLLWWGWRCYGPYASTKTADAFFHLAECMLGDAETDRQNWARRAGRHYDPHR